MNMTQRVFPPEDGKHPTIAVNGRTWTCALGSSLDVPDQDAAVMLANGWTSIGTVGTTAQRPTNPPKGQQFHDTTLGVTIKFDGKVWRDPATANAV